MDKFPLKPGVYPVPVEEENKIKLTKVNLPVYLVKEMSNSIVYVEILYSNSKIFETLIVVRKFNEANTVEIVQKYINIYDLFHRVESFKESSKEKFYKVKDLIKDTLLDNKEGEIVLIDRITKEISSVEKENTDGKSEDN